MEIQEFILLDKAKVRRDSNLMHLYLEFFKQAYKYTPSCAGCSFGSDWDKLVSFYSKNTLTLPLKEITMNTIEIKKRQGKILSYRKDGITYRSYDTNLNDSFINGYLENGTDEELAERKKMFHFPKELDVVEASIESNDEVVATINNEITDSLGVKNVVIKKRGRKSKK